MGNCKAPRRGTCERRLSGGRTSPSYHWKGVRKELKSTEVAHGVARKKRVDQARMASSGNVVPFQARRTFLVGRELGEKSALDCKILTAGSRRGRGGGT